MAVEHGRRRSDAIGWQRNSSRPGPEREDDAIDLWSIGRHVWRFRWKIAAGAAALSLAVWLLALVIPHRYHAVAIVLIDGPRDVRVEPFQEFARSDEITKRVMEQLAIPETASAAEARRLSVTLYPSRESGTAYAPWIGLTASTDSPEMSQTLANTWASVLVAHQAASGIDEAAALSGLEGTKVALDRAEREMQAAEARHAAELLVAESNLKSGAKTAELEARYARIVVLEDDLAEMRAGGASGRDRTNEGAGREQALTARIQHHRSRAESLFGDVLEAKRSLAVVSNKQSVEMRKYQRALGDAAERHRLAAIGTGRPIRLKIGSLAERPPGIRERSIQAAMISVPFALLLCLGVAFIAAIGAARPGGAIDGSLDT